MRPITAVSASRLGVGFALLLTLAARPGWPAGQLRTLEDLVDVADEIVVARVVETETLWQNRLIVTVATLEVEEALKGVTPASLEVIRLGGMAVHPTLGKAVHMSASHQAVLSEGEHVLLFLGDTSTGQLNVVGGSIGKFLIETDAASAERRLPVGPKQLAIIQDDGAGTIVPRAISLDQMKARIAARLKLNKKTGGTP